MRKHYSQSEEKTHKKLKIVGKQQEEDEYQFSNNVPTHYVDDLDRKMKDINLQIELIGKICDTKMAQSYEEYHNTIKSSKAQLWDDLTKLNFKLIEYKKQNTKEDYISKLKADLKSITQQVQQKDKELSKNSKMLEELETKINSIDEERNFLAKEIKNSKYYNQYLKAKLKQLEETDPSKIFEELQQGQQKQLTDNMKKSIETKNTLSPVNNHDSESDMEDQIIAITNNPADKKKKVEKLEHYIEKNKDIIDNKLNEVEGKLNLKYKRLNLLENFKNPILHVLYSKTVNYITKMNESKNGKIQSKDIFFRKDNQASLTNSLNISSNSESNLFQGVNLHKRDKREIVKDFLSDEITKKIVYSILYKEDNF